MRRPPEKVDVWSFCLKHAHGAVTIQGSTLKPACPDLARATRMRQPPEKVDVGRRCAAESKDSPARIAEARASAVYASISSSRWYTCALRRHPRSHLAMLAWALLNASNHRRTPQSKKVLAAHPCDALL